MAYAENPQRPVAADPARDVLLALGKEHGLWALFLDIDGTLIDLAPTPDAVTVPAQLPAQLRQLSEKLGGALALVTGRELDFADALFSPHRFPLAGLHGAERRNFNGDIERFLPSDDFSKLKNEVAKAAADWPGVIVEDKGAAIAAHYRLAPDYGAAVEAMMARFLIEAGAEFTLQRGKMVIEIRPLFAGKGRALEAFLAAPPFAGRRPIAIGDDVTDEEMFAAANKAGGISIRIGASATGSLAQSLLPSPAALRGLIAELADAPPDRKI